MRLLLSLTFALAGCASPEKPVVPGNLAVKSRYWAIQDANRERTPLAVPLRLPERIEDGALRVPSTHLILIPSSP